MLEFAIPELPYPSSMYEDFRETKKDRGCAIIKYEVGSSRQFSLVVNSVTATTTIFHSVRSQSLELQDFKIV